MVLITAICIVITLALCVDEVTAKAQPRHKRRRKSMQGQSMKTYFSMLKLLYAVITVPLVGFLLYAVLRDPITPHIIKELWYRLQEAVTGQKIVLDEPVVAAGGGNARDAPEAAARARTARSVGLHAHQA